VIVCSLELWTGVSYRLSMVDLYINRRLKIDEEHFSEREVLERGPVLVVLAEPGAGKTELLKEFGRIWGVAPVRASIFRHRAQLPRRAPLIIDALDEAAKIDQSAVDQVVVKAQEMSNGNVIFASRSYAWGEARTRWVRECFGVDPIIVRIEHFTSDEQRLLFEAHLPGEDFAAFSAEVDRFGLSPLLGNPQFLRLFADAYLQSSRRFTSKRQIFRDAVERLAIEAGTPVTGRRRPARSEIIAVGSEVMAKLLLAGGSGVSTKEQLADADYPYMPALASSNIEGALQALDTKLFNLASDPDHHEPVHRIVAEYCAAQYLVGRATDRKSPFSLRRIFAIIAPNGTVRDELRGLLGWMASVGPARVQWGAIELDPYAVLANGDPSQLTTASKKLLIQRLARVAEANPGFRRSDHRRSFSVGGFFTEELAGDVGQLLRSTPITSPLIDLLLELLANSGGPQELASDVRAILLNRTAGQHTRLWASRALIKLTGGASPQDLQALVEEATGVSLRVATDLILSAGANTFTDNAIEALLRALISVYPPRGRMRDETSHMAPYYLKEVLRQLTPVKIALHLDRLTAGLTCTCQRREYDCRCRNGASKIIGRLLDQYFGTAIGPHHPDRLWGWMQSIWYDREGRSERSVAIRALAENAILRHQLHQRAFTGITERNEAWEILWRFFGGHCHSGLSLLEGDSRRMADFAFETDNPGLWAAFWSRPRDRNHGPDTYRRHLREQAAAKPGFAAEWAKLERSFRATSREHHLRWGRRRRRRMRREAQQEEADRSNLIANRETVESGNHWGWVRTFAELYLFDRERIADYTDDISIAENALRNCLPFLSNHIPSLDQLARNERGLIARVVFASCWIQFRDRGNLDHVARQALLAARVDTAKQSWMSDDEYAAFEGELDRLLFREPGDAEVFARAYIEPGLMGPREGHSHVWWLSNKAALAHLRSTLSIEWLRAYPAMPISAREGLFNLVARTTDRAALLDLIRERATSAATSRTSEDAQSAQHRMEDLRFWQLRRFFFESAEDDGWDNLRGDPNAIFAIDVRAGRFGDVTEGWPSLSAEKIYKILDAFVEVWPPVPLPSSYGSDDPPEERAYRFLTDIVWRIGRDSPERALPVIDRLIADARFAGFAETLLTLRAESAKKLALADFTAPTPQEVASTFDATGVASVEDLRALVVEELEWLQAWLRTAETDPLATYYQGGNHVNENTARNRVVDRLSDRMTAMNMPVVIEHHMAEGNRCDFTVSAMIEGRRRLLVVEAKGQWHPEVFSAASAQLNARYANHHDAEQQGIYLVFWFGPETKVADRVRHGIATAAELRERIVDNMPPELRGRIDVVVLDLSRAHAGVALERLAK
jgi:hypothetical protein